MNDINKKTQIGLPVVVLLLGIAIAWGAIITDMQTVKAEIKELKVAVITLNNMLLNKVAFVNTNL